MRINETDLTKAEQKELSEQLAAGNISRSCPRARIDWFNVTLKNGTRVAGSYRWESGEDWIDIRVYRKKGARQ